MLPLLNLNSERSLNCGLNSTRHKKENSSMTYSKSFRLEKPLWLDKSAPDNLEQIYKSCEARLLSILKRIDELDREFNIKDDYLFPTLNKYAMHLNRLKAYIGLNEIKSTKIMHDLINIIHQNIKEGNTEEEVERRRREELLKRPPSSTSESSDNEQTRPNDNQPKTEPDIGADGQENTADQAESEEQQLKEKEKEEAEKTTKNKLNFADSLSYVTKKKKQSKHRASRLLTRSDSIITPLLEATKRSFILVKQETRQDTHVLSQLLHLIEKQIKEDYVFLLDELDSINAILKKYLQSHMESNLEIANFDEKRRINEFEDRESIKTETLLRAALKYNEDKENYFRHIDQTVYNLRRLIAKFDDGTTNGITLKDLSEDTVKMCKRFDGSHIQAVLVVPELSSQIKKAVTKAFNWIDYDKAYSGFILDDLNSIGKRKKNLFHLKHAQETAYNQLMHKFRAMRNAIELSDHIARKADDSYFGKPKATSKSIKLKRSHYNRLNNKYAQMDCRLMIEQMQVDFDQLEANYLKTKKQLNHLRMKKASEDDIEQKHVELDLLIMRFYELEDQLVQLYNEKRIRQDSLNILENCHFKLKEIYMFKTCSDSVKKIFFELPLSSLKFGMPNNELNQPPVKLLDEYNTNVLALSDAFRNNILDTSIEIIARMIGSEWVNLYYRLSFYPERGMETVKRDVEKINEKFNRGNSFYEQALSALKKWKRFNVRATLGELRDVLFKMDRHDILKDLDVLKNSLERKKEIQRKESLIDSDPKKREAELLHQKLAKFFEKQKAASTTALTSIRSN